MRLTRVAFTNRQADNAIFYKVETLVEIHKIPNFVKIVRAVLKIYENYVNGQTDNQIFYKLETYLDRFLLPEIYIIPNFVKIVRAVLEIKESCVHGQTDRKLDFLQS